MLKGACVCVSDSITDDNWGEKKSHTFESERHNSLIYCVNFDT